MRTNIYKPINRTRVMAAFYNGSSTEQNAILKWLREPYDTPYVPPMINTRDLRNLEIWVPGKRDRRHEVEPGDVIVRDIDTGELTIVPRDEFFERYTYADHIEEKINVNYVDKHGNVDKT